MKTLITKIAEITDEKVIFENGYKLYSYHEQDCCENHYLDFEHLSLEDVEDLEFDLYSEFFEKIEGYGVALIPTKGFPIRIPGYGYNNGWYSNDLTLVLESPEGVKYTENITECQVEEDG